MKYILRKYVDANSAAEALKLDRKTPVHDLYLKDGEEPKRGESAKDLVGFRLGTDTPIGPYEDELVLRKKR